jgi:hypothetical protein
MNVVVGVAGALLFLVVVFVTVRLVVGPIGRTRKTLFRPRDNEV